MSDQIAGLILRNLLPGNHFYLSARRIHRRNFPSFKIGEHVLKTPPSISRLRPMVVVFGLATREYHSIYGTRATEHGTSIRRLPVPVSVRNCSTNYIWIIDKLSHTGRNT